MLMEVPDPIHCNLICCISFGSCSNLIFVCICRIRNLLIPTFQLIFALEDEVWRKDSTISHNTFNGCQGFVCLASCNASEGLYRVGSDNFLRFPLP